jgi:site-specific DNA-methyltransferase (adenine-specific)
MNNSIQVQQTPVDSLIPFARNARTHSDEQVKQIAASIREFGFNNPILIREDLTVIAGHGRLAAAKVLGIKEVPTISLSHLSPTQVRAYVLADNKLALNAGWDDKMLSLELEELQMEGFDLSLMGFSTGEVDEIFAECTIDGLTDEDDAPDVSEYPQTQPGDVWICGRHRVMCGDAASAESVTKLLQGKKADLWITDPPYNVAYQGGTKEKLTIQNDSMSTEDFRVFLRGAYSAADQNLKEGGSFYIWYAGVESYNFIGAGLDIGWDPKHILYHIWKKDALVLGRSDYQYIHEPCLFGWKAGAAHSWESDRCQTTVYECKRPRRSGVHPTMKPVELFTYQIGNSSKKGELVLDSFGGSGTTMIACEEIGRAARLIEIDPKYCDVIVKRWQDFTGKKATLESNGKTFDELKNK